MKAQLSLSCWNVIWQTNKLHALLQAYSTAAQAFPIGCCLVIQVDIQNLLQWIMFMYECSREKPPFGESINFSSETIQKAPMEKCVVVAAPPNFNKSLYFNFDLAQFNLFPREWNSSRRMTAKEASRTVGPEIEYCYSKKLDKLCISYK